MIPSYTWANFARCMFVYSDASGNLICSYAGQPVTEVRSSNLRKKDDAWKKIKSPFEGCSAE